jgi:hypothetical protein
VKRLEAQVVLMQELIDEGAFQPGVWIFLSRGIERVLHNASVVAMFAS